MELRCPAKMHAKLISAGPAVIEIKCNSRQCGAGSGYVVLHQWDLVTGELLGTNVFRDPKFNNNSIKRIPLNNCNEGNRA